MRNSIIKQNDGEEMTVQPGKNSLLEFIRILEFNPYSLGTNLNQRINDQNQVYETNNYKKFKDKIRFSTLITKSISSK